MTVSIGNVWDSTTDVLAGRGGMLAPIAALAFFAPAVLQAAVKTYGGASAGIALLSAAVAMIALLAALWGQMTVIGVASDPDMTRAAAGEAARRRLGPAVLVTVVLAVVVMLALLPIGIALAASGYDFAAAARPGAAGPAPVAPAVALFCAFYGLALLVAGLWFGARLSVWTPVVLQERRGIGAIGRSMALTRGLTSKLIGVGLLAVVIFGVASLAAQYVVFIPLRLVLGADGLATAALIGGIASAIVQAAFTTVVAVFTARLYAAIVPAVPRDAG